jgi:hypothetical protein
LKAVGTVSTGACFETSLGCLAMLVSTGTRGFTMASTRSVSEDGVPEPNVIPSVLSESRLRWLALTLMVMVMVMVMVRMRVMVIAMAMAMVKALTLIGCGFDSRTTLPTLVTSSVELVGDCSKDC